MTFDTGTMLGGYRIEVVLGSGSMGTVYSALDVALERRIALKVLTPELARDERFRERFLRESKLAASLEHPHIVPIHSAGEAEGVLYLAMRYVDGEDLSALLRTLGRLDPERTVAILDQIAGALDAAHGRGLVHRDVKPANILLAKGDYAYLCDFGLAKHASTVSSLTGNRAIVGTVDYLAPEQVQGKPVDGRVDVYALGAVLYECLTGEPPHSRENELAALLAHVNDPPPRPSERRADLPEALDDVIATALAKDREARFATCAALAEAARAALGGEVPVLPAVQAAAPAVRTFLFADVRGYTAFTRERGDEAAAELARRFAALVEGLTPEHGGTLQELRGDEALVVFGSPRQALRSALALQAKVAEDELPRPVGIGLDTGEAVPVEGGYRGGALNRAARLCSLAKPGEVPASDAVCELAGATDGVRYGFRRVERLKGFEKPVGVVEIHPVDTAPSRELGRRLRRGVVGGRPRWRVAAALAVVGLVIAALFAFLRGDAPDALGAGTVGLLDAKTLEPVGSFDDLGAPEGILNDEDGGLWAWEPQAHLWSKIEPKTRTVGLRIPARELGSLGYLAVGSGSVWIGDLDDALVGRYHAQYGSVQATIRLPTTGLDPERAASTLGLAFADGSLWAAYGSWPFRVARIDPATNRVVKTFDLRRADGNALISSGDAGLWVLSAETGRMWRIDPKTNAVVGETKLHDGYAWSIAQAGGYVWVAIQGDGAVWKLDHEGNVLKSVPTGDEPLALEVSDGYLYLANRRDGTLSRIDPATDDVQTVVVGHRPTSAGVAGGLVWTPLLSSPEDVLASLDGKAVLTIASDGDPYYRTDPAFTQIGAQQQLQHAVGAGLLRYPDVEQPRGATLLPEIAELPVVSRDGRTYTFRIKPGYRFSPPSNEQVTAETMRYTIERALSPKLNDPAASAFVFVQDIVGAEEFHEGRAEHISGLRARGDRLSITLERPAADLPSRLVLPYFTAVPIGTPALARGVEQPIPSAGPYYISSHVIDDQLVLLRNPNYSGPRPRKLDAIVVEASTGSEALEDTKAGRADYYFSGPTVPEMQPGGPVDDELGAESAAAKAGAQRYFSPLISGVQFLQFDTRDGPFADRAWRIAVGHAIDRPAVAAALGSVPSSDLLPPGIPGAGGTPVFRPDGPARTVRRLGRRSALLYIHPDCVECAEAAAILRENLARVGVALRFESRANPWGDIAKRNSPADAILSQWFVDYVDPSNVIDNLFLPISDLGYGFRTPTSDLYSDPEFIGRMLAANQVRGEARARAYRTLVRDMLRESPPAVAIATMRGMPQLFSERVGCQVFRPQSQGLVNLAALCLK